MKAMQDKAGLDGLAKSNFVGQQHPRVEAPGGFGGDGKLMRKEVDTGTGEAARGSLADARVPLERLESVLEVLRWVAQPGEQALVRTNEIERVEQRGLNKLSVATVVGENAVAGGNSLDGELMPVPVGDHIARAKADADEWRGSEGVGADLLGGRKMDLDLIAFHGTDQAKTQ